MSPKILTFSWNTASIRLCETLSEEEKIANRTNSITGKYGVPVPGYSWYDCEIPDFFEYMASKITETQAEIVVIGFQEDAYPGSYFHSHLLPTEMPKLGYKFVKRTKLQGLGVTTVKALYSGDVKLRGLRLSIYVRDDYFDSIESIYQEVDPGYDGQKEYVCTSSLTRGKGATASYLKIKGSENLIAIINCHLPFAAKSLFESKDKHNRMIRQNALFNSNLCFNNIIENLVLNYSNVSHVILMGDLNYRVWFDNRGAIEIGQEILDKFLLEPQHYKDVLNELYLTGDELVKQMRKENIYNFLEGVNNEGPLFAPTCKMKKNREYLVNNKSKLVTDFWNIGHNQRIPSWCDRILYQKFNNSDMRNIICTYYDSFDVGNVMKMSDHSGVVAIFELL